MAKRKFTKTYSNSTDLVKLLKTRGMRITNEQKAKHQIDNIGYYRLSAYMYPLIKQPKKLHQHKDGTSFENVMTLYRFDKKLRMLLFNEIEKVEIAIREAVMNITAEISGDDYWITNSDHFINPRIFNDTFNLIEKEYHKSTEEFIQHFKKEYVDPFPPVWILGELLSMGTVNMAYRNLKENKIRKEISLRFGLQPKVFESWFTTLTLVRNACCHHARMWNKTNVILPMVPKTLYYPWVSSPPLPQKAYFNICIIKYFLNTISPNNNMSAKAIQLFKSFPGIDIQAIGFPNGWETEPLWTQ